MKKKDLMILCELRNNARMQLTDISKRTHIPISTIYDRLKSYNGKIVKKHSALIDFAVLGYVVKAHLIFAVERAQKEEFSKHMQNHPNVNSLWKINNGYDYIAEVLYKDINSLEYFLDELCQKFKVKEKKTYYIIEELKKETFMSQSNLVEAGLI